MCLLLLKIFKIVDAKFELLNKQFTAGRSEGMKAAKCSYTVCYLYIGFMIKLGIQ